MFTFYWATSPIFKIANCCCCRTNVSKQIAQWDHYHMIVRNWLFSIFLQDSYERYQKVTGCPWRVKFSSTHRYTSEIIPRQSINDSTLGSTSSNRFQRSRGNANDWKGCRPLEPWQIKWQLVIIHPKCIKEPPLKQGVSGYNGPCRWRGTPWSKRKRKGGGGMKRLLRRTGENVHCPRIDC